MAGGAAPSALSLTCALVFAGLLGTFLTGKRPSLPRLIVIVGGSQLAFHQVFSLLSPGTATGGSHHGGFPVLSDSAAVVASADPAMWGAHMLAMAGTIVFLRHAEQALWNLLREALAAVHALPGSPVPAAAPVGAISETPEPIARRVAFLSAFSYRGPPRASGA